MSPKTLPLVSLAVALLALCVAALALAKLPAKSSPPSGRPDAGREVARKVAGLAVEVRTLREELAALSLARADAPAALERAPLPSDPTPDPEVLANLGERIDALERELGTLEESVAGDAELVRLDALRRLVDRRGGADEPDVPEWQARAVAFDATDEARLQALRALRGRRAANGADARSTEVLASMLEMAQRSDDPEVRADVFRQSSGAGDPILRGPLLFALFNDDNAEVREEAAETLADFLPDAEVEAALRQAAGHDPDRSVRDQAEESLEEGG